MCRTTIAMMGTVLMAVLLVTAQRSHAAPPQQSPPVRGYPMPGLPGIGVEQGRDPAGNILELLIYRGNSLLQTLKVCTDQPVPLEGAIGTMDTTDYNFDGYADLALQVASNQGNASYCIWLYDPQAQRFVASKQLSQVTNPQPDITTQTVTSYKNEGCHGACFEKTIYRWSKGNLIPVRYERARTYVKAASVGGLFHFKSSVRCRLLALSGRSNRAHVVRYWGNSGQSLYFYLLRQ